MRQDRGRSRAWAHVVVLACLGLAAACAAHRPRSLADRFVTPASKDDIENDPLPDMAPPAALASAAVTGAAPEVPAMREATNKGPVAETEDAALGDALAAMGASPTVEQLRRAAAEYRRLRVYDRAQAYLQQALKLNPRDAAVSDELARVWRDWGLPEYALGAAHRAIAYAPGSAPARNTLGTVLYAMGDLPGAEREFARAVTLDPAAAYAQNNLCYVAFLRGDAARAAGHCDAAIALDPTLAAAHNNLGLLHAATGDMEQAGVSFTRGGGPAAGLYNTGIAHLARREYALAAGAFDSAFAAEPLMFDAWRRANEARALQLRVRAPLAVRK